MKSPLIHFLIALSGALVVAVSYGVWYTTVSHKSQEVAAIEAQIVDANKNVSRIAAARAALAEIANDEANVRSYFVAESGVVSFITSLERLGAAQKASVNVLSVATNGTPAHPTLVLSLSVRGTFDAVMRTIGAIEYSPYDLSISTLSVAEDDKNVWNASLSLSVGSAPTTATSTP